MPAVRSSCLGLALLGAVPQVASGAAPPAAAASAAQAEPAVRWILGRWAREADGCRRPELVFEAASATVQVDADGQALAEPYRGVRYLGQADGRVVVELGRPHPYGKTASATALAFSRLPGDGIGFAQGRRTVVFRRCAAAAR